MAKAKFIVNWKVEGVTDDPLLPGHIVEFDSETEPALALLEAGAITRDETDAPMSVEDMTPPELADYAKKVFGVALDRRRARDWMLKVIHELEDKAKGVVQTVEAEAEKLVGEAKTEAEQVVQSVEAEIHHLEGEV